MEKENIEKTVRETPWTPGNDGTMHGTIANGQPTTGDGLHFREPYSGDTIRIKPNVVFDIGGDPCGPKGKSIEEIRIYPGDEEKAIIYILRAANLLRGYPRQEANVKALRECFANIIAEAR